MYSFLVEQNQGRAGRECQVRLMKDDEEVDAFSFPLPDNDVRGMQAAYSMAVSKGQEWMARRQRL